MFRISAVLLLIALLSVCGMTNVYADQDGIDSSSQDVSLNFQYFKGYITDTKDIVTSPLRWDRDDWFKASLVVATTLGLYAFDENINEWIQDNRYDDIAEFAEHFGDRKEVLPPLLIFYGIGHVFKNKKIQRTALLTIENVVITSIFTQVIKYSFQRHRPRTGDPYDTFDGPGGSGDHLAFPSGHTSLAFSIATPIATEYKDNVIVPPLAYGLASLVGWSRMNDNAHWASDVFMGAALGYFTGKAICKLHEKEDSARMTISPVIGREYSAVMVSYGF